MRPALSLSLYAVGLVAIFAIAYVAGQAFIPESLVHGWLERAGGH